MKQTTGSLTQHFTIDEYGVNQTETIYISQDSLKHAEMLEEFRTWLGRPINVHAWFRTAAYNKKVGGISTSSHLRGVATDFSTNKAIDETTFIKYAKNGKKSAKNMAKLAKQAYTHGVCTLAAM